MTREQIKKGESDTLEFKREFPDKEKKVLKTIAAFANCSGGTVVIGVDDETLEVVGVNEELHTITSSSESASIIAQFSVREKPKIRSSIPYGSMVR